MAGRIKCTWVAKTPWVPQPDITATPPWLTPSFMITVTKVTVDAYPRIHHPKAATMPAANGHAATANGHAVKTSGVKSRAALKRLKAKAKKAAGSSAPTPTLTEPESDAESVSSVMTVESFLDAAEPTPESSEFSEFQKVFQHFTETGEDGLIKVEDGPNKGHVYYSDDEDEDEEGQAARKTGTEGMTRRERRRAAKLSVAELKQLVDRPEVVEWFDCDARDPRLLVTLKTVPIPSHWNAKRDYLSGRRGMEKTPYRLPREFQ